MKSFSKMVYPYVLWALIMIVVPMMMLVLYAFTVKGNAVLTFQFTFDNFIRFFSDPVFPGVLWRSLKLAVITTLICIGVGYPTALLSEVPASAVPALDAAEDFFPFPAVTTQEIV